MQVEDAISLLPQIPETQRDEVWTYWQVISVAVKAAVGGRGPIVAKRTKTGAARGRPRGRPCLYGQRRKVVMGNGSLSDLIGREETVGGGVETASGKCSDEKCDTVDSKKGLEQLSLIKPKSPQNGTRMISDANRTESSFDSQIPHTSNSTFSEEPLHPHVPTTVAAPASSEISVMTAEHVSAETLADQEFVVKVSREGGSSSGPLIHFVSVPKGTSASKSPQTSVKVTAAETSNINQAAVTSAVESISGPPLQVSGPHLPTFPVVKRKRGRPPKQTLPTSPPVQIQQKDIVQGASCEVGSEGKPDARGSSESSTGDVKLQNDLQSIITALELEEKKSKRTTTAVAPSAGKVRRSERRAAPNRDKLFCYFDQTQREEEEEVVEEQEEDRDGSTTAMSIAEKLVANVKQESKEMRVKSEDEKVEERTCHVCSAVLMSASSMAGTENY